MFTEKQIGVSALVVTMLIFSSSGSVFQRILNAEKSGAACNTTETYNTSNTSNCSNDVAVVFTACNMLCGSNLIGLVTLPPLFRSDLTMKNIYAITRWQWLGLTVGTLLYSVGGPLLYYTAVETVPMPTVAILQRLESVEFLLWARIFNKERFSWWVVGNAALTVSGVLFAVLSPPWFGKSIQSAFPRDAVFVILSGLCYSSSLIVSKKVLGSIPVGIVGMFRVITGTSIYHLIVLIRRQNTGSSSYLDADLWKVLAWYGPVYVTAAQVCWLTALAKADSVTISMGTTSLFVLVLGWSAAVTEKYPTNPQVVGTGILLVSLGSSLAEVIVRGRREKKEKLLVAAALHDNDEERKGGRGGGGEDDGAGDAGDAGDAGETDDMVGGNSSSDAATLLDNDERRGDGHDGGIAGRRHTDAASIWRRAGELQDAHNL